MRYLVYIIFGVLSVFGLSYVIREMILLLMRTKTDISLLAVIKSAEDCECAVRDALARGESGCVDRVICIDVSEDAETKSILAGLKEDFPQLTVCKRDELVYNLYVDNVRYGQKERT